MRYCMDLIQELSNLSLEFCNAQNSWRTFVFTFSQLAEGIGKVKVSIKKAKHDYYNYQPKDNMDYHGEYRNWSVLNT